MSKLAKTILITGASSGFGRDTAETLTREGHSVFASFRDSAGRNKSHAEALQSKGINVVELDVTNNDSVERAVSNVLSRAGRIDVVINNAGIASAGVSEAFTAEQVRDLFEVNVFGIQRVLRAVLPTLRKQRDGLVINVGSILGRVTFPFFGLYGASKICRRGADRQLPLRVIAAWCRCRARSAQRISHEHVCKRATTG